MTAWSTPGTPGTATLTNGRTQINTVFDATVGPRITSLVDDPAGTPLTMDLCADVDAEDNQGGLWWVEGRTRKDKAIRLTPDDAAFYDHYTGATTTAGDAAEVFEWRGIAVPDSTATLWVRIALILPASGSGIEFAGWCGPEKGDDFQILYFDYPTAYLKSYAGGTGTKREQAFAQRVIVPQNIELFSTTRAQNFSVGAVSQARLKPVQHPPAKVTRTDLMHPMPFWPMSFVATAACNPADTATYLRTVLFTAQERTADSPWAKRLDYSIPFKASGADHYINWRAAHLPPIGDDWGRVVDGSVPNLSPYRNSAGPHWIPTIETFEAASEAWWYDCCEKYRDYFTSVRSPQPVRSNTDLEDIGKAPFVAQVTNHVNALTVLSGPNDRTTWLPSLEHVFDNVRGSMGIPASDWLLHLQSWAWYFEEGGIYMCRTDGTDIYAVTHDIGDKVRDAGSLLSLYYRPIEFYGGWFGHTQFFHIPEIVYLRSTNTQIPNLVEASSEATLTNEVGPGFDRPETQTNVSLSLDYEEFADNFVRLIHTLRQFHGRASIYMDTLAGAWQPNILPGPSNAWGTNLHIKRRQELANRIRARHGVPVTSEAVTEWMESLDIALGGSPTYFNHQIRDWESTYYSSITPPARFTDPPYEARNPNPPLWQTVHAAHNPRMQYGGTPEIAMLSPSPFVSTGIGQTEWIEFKCYEAAAAWIVGAQTQILTQLTNIDLPPVIDAQKSANLSLDPAPSVGPQHVDFLKLLYRAGNPAWAGDWIIDGTMLRPPKVDLSDTITNTMRANPLTAPSTVVFDASTTAAERFAIQTTFFAHPDPQADPTGATASGFYAGFSCPAVMVTAWESTGGTKAFILLNWSDANGSFQMTIDQSLYGLSGTVTVNSRAEDGTLTVLGSSAAAAFTIGDVSSDINTGVIPRRSILVLTLS